MLRRLVERSGRPLSVSLLEGAYGPMTLRWRDVLDWAAEATAAGLPIKAQVLSRAIGVMLGHELTLNTFYTCASYVEARAPAVRREDPRAAAARDARADPRRVGRSRSDHRAGPPRARVRPHVPAGRPARLRAAVRAEHRRESARLGVTPEELAYDLMLERDGRNNLYVTLCNYEHGSLDSSLEMMRHPGAVLGLGDGGAHCGTICDGSYPTFMLTHWVRDRRRGERLPLAAGREMAQPRHGAGGGSRRSRNHRAGLQGGSQRRSTSIACVCTRRKSRTTCRAADGVWCSAPMAMRQPS